MIRPGITTPDQADELNQMLAEWRLWKQATHSPPIVSNGQGSLGLDLTPGAIQLGLLVPAQITPDVSGGYNWVESQPVVDGTWIPKPGGLTGSGAYGSAYPARDPNGSPALPSGNAWLTPGMYGNGVATLQDWLVVAAGQPDALVRVTSQSTSVITTTGLAEVQTITAPAGTYGGTFLTSVGTFSGISTAAQAQTVLDASYGGGVVAATGGPLPAVPIVVTWQTPGPQAVITVTSSSLTPTGTASVTETTLGVAAQNYNAYPGKIEQSSPYTLALSDSLSCWVMNLESSTVPPIATDEVQTLSITGGTPTSGSFKLTWNGQTTGTIAYNASAATVQTALRALSNVGGTNITCSGGSLPGTAVVITFTSSFANLPQNLITAGTNTMNNSAVPGVARTTAGTSAVMEGYLIGYANDGKAVYYAGEPTPQITVTSVNAGTGDSTISLTNQTIEIDLASGLNVASDDGKPKVLLQAASSTHAGGISLGNQTLGTGIKTADAYVSTTYVQAGSYMQAGSYVAAYGSPILASNFGAAGVYISCNSGSAQSHITNFYIDGATYPLADLMLGGTLSGGVNTGANCTLSFSYGNSTSSIPQSLFQNANYATTNSSGVVKTGIWDTLVDGSSVSGGLITTKGSNTFGTGSVTSVALTAPSGELTVSGSPITTSGTLALTWHTQTANTIFAGPSSGAAAAPTFRTPVPLDLAGSTAIDKVLGISHTSTTTLEYKTIAGSGGITVTPTAGTLTIDGSGAGSGTSFRGVTNGGTCGNTTTETTILNGTLAGTLNLAANFWTQGKVVRIKMGGTVVSTGSPNLTIRVKDTVAPTTLASNTYNAFPNISSLFWLDLTIVAVDNSGTLTVQGVVLFNSGGIAGTAQAMQLISATVSVTPGNSETLDVTAQWSAANMMNSITAAFGTVEW